MISLYIPLYRQLVRNCVLIALGLLLLPQVPVSSARAQAVLHPHIEVSGDVVTLSDIFSNLRDNHDYVVAQAPAAGKELVLNATTLKKIARSFAIDWMPETSFVNARITRQSQAVSSETLEQLLLQSLAAELPRLPASQQWKLELDTQKQWYHAPVRVTLDPTISYLRLDETRRRFVADVRLFDGALPQRLRGEVSVVVQVPVPVYSIEEQRVITRDDLHFVTMRKEKIAPNVQTDVDKIIGKSPKRILRADAPIAMQYLQEPLMVKRKNLVSVVYVVKNLTLATRGMAMSDGSLGQIVRVKNLKSNRIIDTVVTGVDEVSVSFAGSGLALN